MEKVISLPIPPVTSDHTNAILSLRKKLLEVDPSYHAQVIDKAMHKDMTLVSLEIDGKKFDGRSPVAVSAYESICNAEINALVTALQFYGVDVKFTPIAAKKKAVTFDYNIVLSYKHKGVDRLLDDMRANNFDTSDIVEYGKECIKAGRRLTIQKVADKFFTRAKTAVKDIQQLRRKEINPDFMSVYKSMKSKYTEETFKKTYGKDFKDIMDYCKFAVNPES